MAAAVLKIMPGMSKEALIGHRLTGVVRRAEKFDKTERRGLSLRLFQNQPGFGTVRLNAFISGRTHVRILYF
jgi:hypothetical protein